MKFLNELLTIGVVVYSIGVTSCAKQEKTSKPVTQQRLLDVFSKPSTNFNNDTSKIHLPEYDVNSKLYKK